MQNLSGFQKSQNSQGNFKGRPRGNFNFSMQVNFTNNPNKLVQDFTERRNKERLLRKWKCAILVWRLNAQSPWESIHYGMQNFLGRKVDMSPLHDDRAILWCINAMEKEALPKEGYITIAPVTTVKLTSWSQE